MKYDVKSKCVRNIVSFYLNVAKKYKHTYSQQLMRKNISDAYDSMFLIENKLHRRKPTLIRWKNYHMAHSGQWYYAYIIIGETIVIEDACHEQNMHD